MKSEIIHPQAGTLADVIYTARRAQLFFTKAFNRSRRRETTGVYAVYDLTIAPNTYNLAEFLIYADLKAKAKGYKNFTLIIVNRLEKKFNYEYDAIIDLEKRRWPA